jgi:UDP-glucose 4-epimerase
MRLPVRSVLVTGGAGFIGAAVTRRLRSEGLAVRVLDDLSRGRPDRLEGWDVELVVGDVRSARAAREAVEGMDAVVHLAAVRPEGTAHAERVAHDVNVTGTFNLLAAARDAGAAHFVYGSSAAVYGGKKPYLLHEDVATQPSGLEGAQKIAAEAYVRLFAARDGLSATILRLFSVYGPEHEDGVVARLCGAALAGEPALIHGDGTQTRDFIYVEDVAVAVTAALTASGAAGRALNIASGEGIAVRTVAGMIADLVGGTPPPRYVPAPAGEARDVRASVAAAASTLGFRARVRLREGLAACLGMAELPALPLPPRIASAPLPMSFPEGSETKLRSSAFSGPTVPAPQIYAQPPALFGDRPPSWTVTDETEISLGFATESTRDWAP